MRHHTEIVEEDMRHGTHRAITNMRHHAEFDEKICGIMRNSMKRICVIIRIERKRACGYMRIVTQHMCSDGQA